MQTVATRRHEHQHARQRRRRRGGIQQTRCRPEAPAGRRPKRPQRWLARTERGALR
jgi:hypothetical protein